MLFVGSQNFIGVYNFSDPWETRTKISMPPITAQWVKALKTNEKHLFCGTSGQIKVYDLTKEEVLSMEDILKPRLLLISWKIWALLVFDVLNFESGRCVCFAKGVVHKIKINLFFSSLTIEAIILFFQKVKSNWVVGVFSPVVRN